MIQLIATPERFDGQRIQVTGYFGGVQWEESALYLHEEDYRRRITRNGLWMELSDALSKTPAGYVIVDAVLDSSRHGHLSGYQGTLTDVTRLDR